MKRTGISLKSEAPKAPKFISGESYLQPKTEPSPPLFICSFAAGGGERANKEKENYRGALLV
jgi:hypothetical protein